jgi:hypothetical protein
VQRLSPPARAIRSSPRRRQWRLANVSAGFDVINLDGAVPRLQYDGRFGEETQPNSASIKGSVPF